MTAKTVRGKVLAQGRYLTLVDEDGWEYVVRPTVSGIVVIVAITDEGKLVLVQQRRIPVNREVIELPAGMVGDADQRRGESLADAAHRELTEETGYAAAEMVLLAEGPIAVGATDEIVTLYQARGLRRVGPGGGDETENITVHEVPLRQVRGYLRAQQAQGRAVDPKIYAGLFLAGVEVPA